MKKYMVIDEFTNDHTIASAQVFEAESSEQALSIDAYKNFLIGSSKKGLSCIAIYELTSGVNEVDTLLKGGDEK